MTQSIFGNPASQDNTETDEEIDYIAQYSKDGKEPDLKELAKGKWHADQHIARLEKEQAEAREELSKRLSWEELSSKIDKLKATPALPPSNASGHTEHEPENKDKATSRDALSPTQIEEIVRQTVTKETARKAQLDNVQTVKQTLQRTLGANYERTLLQKVSQLGLDQTFVEEIAAKSPSAFYALLGIQADNVSSPTGGLPPRSSMQSGIGKASVKNEEYYEAIRKANPSEYFKPKIQNEMHAMAKQLGDAFYLKK